MKKISLLIITIAISVFSMAQKNVIKFNPIGLTYGKYNLQYERMLTDYTSASISCSYINPNIPEIAMISDVLSSIGIEGSFDGYAVELDYRLYSKNKPGPRGFYIGPYFRHTNLGLVVELDPQYGDIGYLKEGFIGTRTGAGLKFGAQWVLFNCVTIDWNFFGFGFDYYGLKIYSEGTSGEKGKEYSFQDVEKSGGFLPGFNSDFAISYTF
jgi:hypothetical protein